MNFYEFSDTLKFHQIMELAKKPGQDFCDKYNWRITDYFDVVQRPDKITWCGGSIYRTHTPIKHIWYKSKKNKNHNIWLEFLKSEESYKIIIKDWISVSKSINKSQIYLYPDPNKYKTIRYFDNGDEALQYILNSYN